MSDQPLFTPLRMGDLDLPNRIVMAPLTRMRAGSINHVPTALQAEYYAQRASAGLIVAEATAISADGFGYADTPGLWNAEQVRGWRQVTNAVHAAGGRIIAQLWPTLKYEPGIIAAEGDFVIVHGRFSGLGAPVNWIAVDIVRLKDGILVEHWDVIQDEATKEQSKSGNPMFGDTQAK